MPGIPLPLMGFLYDRVLLLDPSCAGGSTREQQIQLSWMVVLFIFFDNAPPQPLVFERRLPEGAARRLADLMRSSGAGQIRFQVLGDGPVPVWSVLEALPFVSFQPACRAALDFWQEERRAGRWPPEKDC
jgi:hypothetical protein